MREQSLDVGAKYFAIAIELRRLDDVLQSESYLESEIMRKQALSIERIETTLMECSDDFRRLSLSYHRLVHGAVAGDQVSAGDVSLTVEGNYICCLIMISCL